MFRSSRFNPGKDPAAHWTGGWVGPQTPSGRSEEAINSFLLSGFEPFTAQSTDLSLNWLKLLKEAITNWLGTLRQYLSLRWQEKQNNFDSCWDLNRDVQEYEAGVPPSLPQSSVLRCHSTVNNTHLKTEKISTPETSRIKIWRGIPKGNGDRKMDAMILALNNANEWTFKSHRKSEIWPQFHQVLSHKSVYAWLRVVISFKVFMYVITEISYIET